MSVAESGAHEAIVRSSRVFVVNTPLSAASTTMRAGTGGMNIAQPGGSHETTVRSTKVSATITPLSAASTTKPTS
eukprot:scaffold158120_cov41-Tisochrysis_lutea.AAC.5